MSFARHAKFVFLGIVAVLVALSLLSLLGGTKAPHRLLRTTDDASELVVAVGDEKPAVTPPEDLKQPDAAIEEVLPVGGAQRPTGISSRIHRENLQYEGAPQALSMLSYQQELDRSGVAAAAERLRALIGSSHLELALAAARGEQQTVRLDPVPPVVDYLLRSINNQKGEAAGVGQRDAALRQLLYEAYSPIMQVRALNATPAPFVALANDTALQRSTILWWNPKGPDGNTKVVQSKTISRYSMLSGLKELFSNRKEIFFSSETTLRTSIADRLDAAHAQITVLDEALLRLYNETIWSWQVIDRSKAPLAPYEHAGAEGVCIDEGDDAGKHLTADQYLCLVYLDVLDVVGSKGAPGPDLAGRVRNLGWFNQRTAVDDPCHGAAGYYRRTKRLHRNFVPPVSMVRCDPSSESEPPLPVAPFSVSGEVLRSVAHTQAKKLRSNNGAKLLEKQWMDNSIVLSNVCLGSDGRFLGNMTESSLHQIRPFAAKMPSQIPPTSADDELYIFAIKREHNRRSEKLHVSPLLVGVKNGTLEQSKKRRRRAVCRVADAAFLFPITDPALNLAHMFFRIASNQLSAAYLRFLRTPATRRLSVFHSAYGGDDMMPGNNFRISYSQLKTMWLGVWPTSLPRPPYGASPDAADEPPLLCFDQMHVLWRTMLMYRSKNKLSAGVFNQMPWKTAVPVLRSVRAGFVKCLLGRRGVERDARRPLYRPGDPVVITVVQRRPRRRAIVSLGRLLQALALDVAVSRRAHPTDNSSLPPVALRVVDMDALTPNEQAEVVHGSDILVGPHGAGMAWGLLLRPMTVFVELRDHFHFNPEMFLDGLDHQAFVGSEYGKLVYAAGAHYLHRRLHERIECYGHMGLGIHQCDYYVSQREFVEQMRTALDVFLRQVELFKA
jgi:hypothetical protein